MQKTVCFFTTCLLAVFLAACSLPGLTKISPTQVAPLATQVAPAPTKTARPPAVPATATSAPAQAVILAQIHMLSAQAGWGWAASPDGNLNQLLSTQDGGQTWRDVSPQAEYVYAGSYFFDARAAWLTTYDPTSNAGGVLRTTDGGQTWDSLPPNDLVQNAWLEFSSPERGLAETAGLGAGNAYLNYYQTLDGGHTWEPVLLIPPSPEPGLLDGTVHLCNICGDSLYVDPTRAVITYGDMASDPLGVVRLSISTDLGKHWLDLRLPLPPPYAGGATAPQSPSFFGEQGLLPVNLSKYDQSGNLAFNVLLFYTTLNGGQSWQLAPSVLESEQPFIDPAQVLSAQDAFVRCGHNLCTTHDGAHTWLTLPDNLNFDQNAGGPDYVSQFTFVDPATGWALSGENSETSLWKSADGGTTWKKLSPTLAR